MNDNRNPASDMAAAAPLAYFDLKQLAELRAYHHRICRHDLRAFRLWKHAHNMLSDPLAKRYSVMEGRVLYANVLQRLRLYFHVRREYSQAVNIYLLKHVPQPGGKTKQKRAA
jgi:hypothetical protein